MGAVHLTVIIEFNWLTVIKNGICAGIIQFQHLVVIEPIQRLPFPSRQNDGRFRKKASYGVQTLLCDARDLLTTGAGLHWPLYNKGDRFIINRDHGCGCLKKSVYSSGTPQKMTS
ncbi:Uncharacterised protein [Vibrio cholerae]|nr:Uncharacterised protein [Vibrio cholerae]